MARTAAPASRPRPANRAHSPDGGRYLRQARHRAGLTQEQLAERTALHVRSIRNLESGNIVRPRESSLARLASALMMSPEERRELYGHWGASSDQALDTENIFDDDQTRLNELAAAAVRDHSLVTLNETVQLGEAQQILWWQTEEVLQARVDGAIERIVFFEPGDPSVVLDRLRLTDLENCFVSREMIFPALGFKVFVLNFFHRVARGTSQLIRYRADFASSYSDNQGVFPNVTTSTLGGFFRSPYSFVLQVKFHRLVLPQSISQSFQATPTAPSRVVQGLALDANASTHIALKDPRPGAHGIQWTW